MDSALFHHASPCLTGLRFDTTLRFLYKFTGFGSNFGHEDIDQLCSFDLEKSHLLYGLHNMNCQVRERFHAM